MPLAHTIHRNYRLDVSKKMSRYAGWLPSNAAVHRAFLHKHNEHGMSRMKTRAAHVPSVARFEAAIKADPHMATLFDLIFLQQTRVPDVPAIESFDALLHQMDIVVSAAPSFYIATDNQGVEIGEPIGVPMYLLFDLLSNTGAAYDLFRMPAFNTAIKDLLDSWGEYLTTPSSATVLNDSPSGWFSPIALKMLEDKRGDFNSTYVTPNPDAVDRGYTSWDHFFVRELQEGARPVQTVPGEDNPTIIHNACESTVLRISRDISKF